MTKIKAPPKIDWKEIKVVKKNGLYYYYDKDDKLIMTSTKDLSREEQK